MLRFRCAFAPFGPSGLTGERICSVFFAVFCRIERICSVFSSLFGDNHPLLTNGFGRLNWVDMLRFFHISRHPPTVRPTQKLTDKASPSPFATPPYRKRLPWPITMHCHGHIIVFLLRFASRRDRKTVPGCGLVPEARYPNNPIQAQRSGAQCETLT